MTHSGPFVRGIYLTLHAFMPKGLAVRDGEPGTVLRSWYREAYENRPFVQVLDQPPELTHVVGTNYALVHAVENEAGDEIQVSIAIDNLVKGAGGQAIQAMNLALGLDERAGLTSSPMYPC